jgi:peptidoglycan hydrolase FlgJ
MVEPIGQQPDITAETNRLSSLTGIKFENKTEEKLMKASQQFEAVFLGQLFNEMDKTVERDEMFSGGRGEEMFRSMFYDEIANNTAGDPSTSFGLAKQIYEQMKDLT